MTQSKTNKKRKQKYISYTLGGAYLDGYKIPWYGGVNALQFWNGAQGQLSGKGEFKATLIVDHEPVTTCEYKGDVVTVNYPQVSYSASANVGSAQDAVTFWRGEGVKAYCQE